MRDSRGRFRPARGRVEKEWGAVLKRRREREEMEEEGVYVLESCDDTMDTMDG
jgi:hypothetical protein